MIIRLSAYGRLTREYFPEGGAMSQNFEICKLIGNDCCIFEHVRPKRLYTVLGCKADIDPKNPGVAISMLVDEEGSLKSNSINVLASWLYEADMHGSPILGNVLFVGAKFGEDGPEFCDIDAKAFIDLFQKLSALISDNRKFVERRVPYENPAYR